MEAGSGYSDQGAGTEAAAGREAGEPVSFAAVIERECRQVEERRRRLELYPDEGRVEEAYSAGAGSGEDEGKAEAGVLEAHSLRTLGVCLSGGGIRSATFNLGILQGLAERGLIPYLDYLSTVSGGGYIGSWLHGVIRNRCQGDPRKVEEEIAPSQSDGGASQRAPKRPGPPRTDPVSFLRKYGNYLAPRLGLVSQDFWVMAVIWVRNFLLNQLILAPALAAVALACVLMGMGRQAIEGSSLWWLAAVLAAALVMGAAVLILSPNVRAEVERELGRERRKGQRRAWFESRWWTWVGAGMMFGAAVAIEVANGRLGGELTPGGVWLTGFPVLWAMFLVFQERCRFRESFQMRHARWPGVWWMHLVWMPAVAGGAGAGLLAAALPWLERWGDGKPWAGWASLAYGPPVIVLAFVAGGWLLAGLMGADFGDGAREWLARFGAGLLMVSAGWAVVFTLSVFGPYWMNLLAEKYSKTALGAVIGWIGVTWKGVLAGKSSKTSGEAGGSVTLEGISKVAPPVFLVGYLVAISMGVHAIVALERRVSAAANGGAGGGYAISLEMTDPASGGAGSGYAISLETTRPAESAGGVTRVDVKMGPKEETPAWVTWLKERRERYWESYTPSAAPVAAIMLLVCAVVALVVPLRVNINEFSLHHFYENRLVRCYLGAAHGGRRPNRFTGFDSHDDFALAELRAGARNGDAGSGRAGRGRHPYLGPYAILNTTLNLNAGSELATQERKGASFVFTPIYSGFDAWRSEEDEIEMDLSGGRLKKGGYCETEGYLYPVAEERKRHVTGGPGIGTAMAISGAALNPNCGFHTSAAVSFLLTVFDVRLGWWAGNPRRPESTGRPGPKHALASLLSELFGNTTQRSRYLNLSDGGHFDNMGLYELVKRRCRYIIVCDGEEDRDLKCESLGAAIRKCRADFGVEIDLDTKRIQAEGKFSRSHCVAGKVTYPELVWKRDGEGRGTHVGRPAAGTIVYLKASVTGDEPEDVEGYHKVQEKFPHEPTTDQFFGESQFESYRRLGLHVVESVFAHVEGEVARLSEKRGYGEMERLFVGLRDHWYPPAAGESAAARHAEAYSKLMTRLADDQELRNLDEQVVLPGGEGGEVKHAGVDGARGTDGVGRKEMFYCMDLIQLMETVWTDLNLQDSGEWENPQNAGWVRIFRHWVKQPLFGATWKRAGLMYSDSFREFYEELQEQETGCVRGKEAMKKG